MNCLIPSVEAVKMALIIVPRIAPTQVSNDIPSMLVISRPSEYSPHFHSWELRVLISPAGRIAQADN